MNIPKTKKEITAAETAKSITESESPVPVVSVDDKSAIYIASEDRWIAANYTSDLSMDIDDDNGEFTDFIEFSE